jgi:hypothetical protein
MFFDTNLALGIIVICLCNIEAAFLSNRRQSAARYESGTDSLLAKNFPPSVVATQLRPETQKPEQPQIRQLPTMRRHPHDSERAVRVTINDLRNRFARLENMIGILERVSYAMSRPAAVVDAIRLFALAISSVIVSSLDYS